MSTRTEPRVTTDHPIALARRAAGLTQAELASRLGIAQAQLSNWERGARNPKLSALMAIASALSVPLDSLIPYNK